MGPPGEQGLDVSPRSIAHARKHRQSAPVMLASQQPSLERLEAQLCRQDGPSAPRPRGLSVPQRERDLARYTGNRGPYTGPKGRGLRIDRSGRSLRQRASGLPDLGRDRSEARQNGLQPRFTGPSARYRHGSATAVRIGARRAMRCPGPCSRFARATPPCIREIPDSGTAAVGIRSPPIIGRHSMSSIVNRDPLPPRDPRPSRAVIGIWLFLITLLFGATVVFLQSQM